MALDFSTESFKQMTELQLELSRVLIRANDAHMEAALAAFACIRCARELLDKYPDKARNELLEVVIAFLRHADVVVDGNSVRLFS